ncbi:MAG: uroporphyrinogen-III synthase [Candidatus Acidiferrales bacterium]
MSATDKPLAGKRIVVTRAPEQAGEFGAQLQSLGAEVLFLPTIQFAEAEDTEILDCAIAEMDKFDWVIFTSRNAVKFVARRFQVLRLPPERINHLMLTPQIATIGSATSEEALSVGFIANYQAEDSRGEALGQALSEQVRGKRVLLPRSDRANLVLPRCLRELGADVTEVIAYRTVSSESFDSNTLNAIRDGHADVITLFSPSAYDYLVEEVGREVFPRKSIFLRNSSKMLIATIGPTTSAAVRSDGLEVAIEAPRASAEALCKAIAGYFLERAPKRASGQ